ncbi:hypothetical protein BVX98_07545, partial [bacterium F11]
MKGRHHLDNPSVYMVDSIDGSKTGAAGISTPTWNPTLGGITQDGNLEWTTVAIGFSKPTSQTVIKNTTWKPGKVYEFGNTVLPTTLNGTRYRLTRIKKFGVFKSTIQPNWTIHPGNVATKDGPRSWYIHPPRDFDIDELDMNIQNVYGVAAHFYGRGSGDNEVPTKFTLKNGTIEQGPGDSFRSHAVRIYSQRDITLQGLTLKTKGLESSGIEVNYSKDVKIFGNTIETKGAHKFNRHQLSAAVMVVHTNEARLEDNTIHSGRGWGGIYLGGSKGLIQGNTVYTQSVVTNHYGIMGGGNGHVFRNNRVEADPGQGMRVGGDDNLMENNEIIMWSGAPNHDIGYYSLDGIRLNDYWGGSTSST